MPDFDKIKREINLVDYTSSLGYKIDKAKSTASSIVMQLDHQDKIIIARRNDIWMYFSPYDDQDHGTILDFVLKRSDKTLVEIGRDLSHWKWLGQEQCGDHEIKIQSDAYCKKPPIDPGRISRLFSYCSAVNGHEYLSGRGIDGRLLSSKRFHGRIFKDEFQNAVFPHFKEGQVSALELKNHDIHLFVRGSEKTLWRSNYISGDDQLLIAESPIDAMSYQIIHDLKHGFYIATGGGFSAQQKHIMKELVSKTPWIKSIFIITDHDLGGDKLAARLENAIYETSFTGPIKRHSPKTKGQDWNDVLRRMSAP